MVNCFLFVRIGLDWIGSRDSRGSCLNYKARFMQVDLLLGGRFLCFLVVELCHGEAKWKEEQAGRGEIG